MHTILCDYSITIVQEVYSRRPDMIGIKKEGEYFMMDFSFPFDKTCPAANA